MYFLYKYFNDFIKFSFITINVFLNFNFSLIIASQTIADNSADITLTKEHKESEIPLSSVERKKSEVSQKKPHTTKITYGSARNDLYPFLGRNIKQMQQVGSNENLTQVIQIDIDRPGQSMLTRRYLIEKNKLTQMGSDLSMDSGDIKTLINFCEFAIKNFPADQYILVLWNHGTGIYEPKIRHAINPSQLFSYNPITKLIELNRNIGFMDFINQNSNAKQDVRGICFDDKTGNYITNEKLKEALAFITKNYLGGKKFDIIAFDACLMAMVEVASIIKDYAHIMCASEDVELGTGYDYANLLAPFLYGPQDMRTFAKHLVETYGKTYSKITNDFTQSAIDLNKIHLLESNINSLALELIHGLNSQKNRTVREAIRLSAHKKHCVCFDEPSYKDYGHFLSNLLKNLQRFELKTEQESEIFRNNLTKIIKSGLDLLSEIVIANAVGKNLEYAKGLAICLPDYQIHSSYKKSEFALKNNWLNFITLYLAS